MQKHDFFERKNKKIMCPNCKKFLTYADSRDNSIHKLRCKECNYWIWFNPSNNQSEIHKVPDRVSSSGKRFY